MNKKIGLSHNLGEHMCPTRIFNFALPTVFPRQPKHYTETLVNTHETKKTKKAL